MKAYEYKGFDKQGRPRKGIIDAISPKDAREKLSQQGVLAERIAATGRQLKFPPEKRAMIYRELSALLGAGMPLVRAMDILIQSPEIGESAVILAGVRDSVKEGSSLASALSKASASVTSFESAILEAAERSATVEPMLDRLAAFLEEQTRLKDRVQNALVYPLIILTVGICVAILMLGLLLPRAEMILAGSKVPLPALTRFMVGLGTFMFRGFIPMAGLVFLGVVMFRKKLAVDAEFRRECSRRLFNVPVFGTGYTLLANTRFAKTMAIMVRGGVPVLEGLVLAGKATGNEYIARQAEIEAEAVRHGSNLSDAVSRIPPLAGGLPGWIRIGEASGGLERLLNSAGERYQEHWDRFITRCLSFLEPILILLIGTFVLMVTLSVLLPVLSLSQAVGK